MNAAKDCTLQEKLLRCAMALILAAGALLASVAASPAYAAPSTVDVSIGGKIPYGGFATTWMSADGNIAYCAEPSSPTPAPGSYSTSPVPSGDVTAAIWYSFGSPGFDASMFPGSWYDGGGWDDAKYAAASHVLIAYAYSGSESAATHGTSAEFASWAKSELIGGTFAKMKAGAGKVSAGFEAFCVRTGGGSQTLVSFSWSAGGVKVAKTDSEAGAEPQGDASLDGASFFVVNETGRYVLVGGKYYADGEVCATIKTAPEDGSHVAATGADALPAGNYRIVESGAPEGYDASDVPVAFTVKAGEVCDLTGDPVTDEVFRGGVQVTKSDKELQASEALAGSGHKEAPGEHPGLDGIEFTVTNRSAHKVLVDGEWREPGEAVATLTTAWNDEAGAYTAQTAADALPYGTYDVRETATNGSYLLTDGEPRTFEVRTGDEIVSASADGAALEFRDQVVRNDLELSKKSESDNAGLMVPFAIENAATGEIHVLVTDRNGDASTASSWNRHSRDTNANDALLGHEGPIAAADMDPKAGIWFSLGEDGSSAPVDDSLAALPYGAYTMTELRCDANEGLELITRSFWIDRDSTVAKAVWMGLDDQEGPRISTTAKDGADGDKDVSADAEAKVVDAVAYEGLKAGEEYELSATLVDKATGEPVTDVSGMPVEAKAEFAPALSTGNQDVEISFDASLLGGRDLVVFESLRKDGAEVASHADLSDEGQTVHVAVEVSTQAADAADGDQVIEAGKAKVVDAVAYEGLKAGEEYELSATLVDKATGEPVTDASGKPVGAKAEFAPALSTGSQDVEISFDASLLGGRDLVVFESLRKDGAEVASHADLSDEGQTVHVAVEVGTQAADAADGDQVIEAGKAKVVDTVAYKGLVPGETYIAVGTLMDKGTGEPFLDKDGNEVTARTPFEPEAPSGTVEVTFEFDTEGLAEGDELVVFEKVLDSAGNVVATHEDIDSAEQSVVVDNPDTPEVPEEPYAKTGADAPDGTGYAVAAGIALAAAAGAGGVLAYRKRKTAGASKDAAAEEPAEEPEE